MKRWLLPVVAGVVFISPAHPMIPVIDVGAIAHLITQLVTLQQQLTTLRETLTQAQQTYQAITGPRGMERLLSGTVRNYLPADWQAMIAVLSDASAEYQELSALIQQIIERNAYLSSDQMDTLPVLVRTQLQEQRRSIATPRAGRAPIPVSVSAPEQDAISRRR
jgi:type IV secretion system protein VirB5